MDRVPFDPAAVREQIATAFGHALKLRQVSAGGDASVEMELNATGNVNFDLGRFGIGFTASPRHADGVVVSGPVTVNMAEALEICYDAVAEPKILVACGSEACSGGLFADSRAVVFQKHKAQISQFADSFVITGVKLMVSGHEIYPFRRF